MAFAVIIGLYVSLGAMAAVGTVHLSHKYVPVKFEAAFFGLLLTPIAAFYLAFTAYFGAATAWGLEFGAMAAFAVFGVIGIKAPMTLSMGYALHGAWDVLHEVQAHVGVNVFAAGEITAIPLAYGFFCAAYDWCLAGYFVTRHEQWREAWLPPK
jgi:hypothetical protein